MSSGLEESVESPCISICTLDQNNICLGCFRHLDEITGWHSADNKRRSEILQHCKTRKEQVSENNNNLN